MARVPGDLTPDLSLDEATTIAPIPARAVFVRMPASA